MAELKTYTPPKEVQDTARKGLQLAARTGLVSSPHIRAIGQALANGEPHTKERLRHIASFLKVHSQDATTPGWGREDQPSPAWIGWLMHGGEAGRAWADKKVGTVDMSAGPPEGYRPRDFLELVPELGHQQRAAAQRTPEELADLEYQAILNRSDPRVLIERGGALPPNPLAPREAPTPGSEAEYRQLLSRSDPRLLWKGRKD
jgi:hypothetical protein